MFLDVYFAYNVCIIISQYVTMGRVHQGFKLCAFPPVAQTVKNDFQLSNSVGQEIGLRF